MANGAFLIDNIAGVATPTCAYADANFPAANLIDKIPSVAYRSIGKTALPRWDMGSVRAVSAFAMFNHNIPNDATIKLQFSSNAWGTVAEEVALSWAADHLFGIFTSKNYRYMGLSVALVTGTYIEIGEIFWGTSWLLARNYNWGYHNIKRVYKDVHVNRGHTFIRINAVQRGYALDFFAIPDADRMKFESLLEQEKIVFIPDCDVKEPCYGTVENDALDSTISIPGNAFGLRFWADTQGGA